MLVRFVVGHRDDESCQRLGIFNASYDLIASGQLETSDLSELRLAIGWLEENLPAPPRSRVHRRSIFWFKAESNPCVPTMWWMADRLTRLGIDVDLIRTRKPGRVVFEDAYQVAAIPFRDSI